MKDAPKTKLTAFLNAVNRFYGSDWFIALNALLVLLAWILNIWAAMICVIVALGSASLFISRDVKQLFPALFMFSFTIGVNHKTLDNFAPMLCLIIVLFVGILFNLIFFKRRLDPLKPSNIKGFTCSLIALVIPFALGGVGSPYEHPLAVVAALALIFVMALGYCCFFVSLNDAPDKQDLPKYVLKILFASGIVISIQLLINYARFDSIDQILEAIALKNVHLGWAGPNNSAPMLSMSIPATLYFCIKKNRLTPIFAALALLEYVLIIATGCRGAVLFTTLAMPAMLFYVAVKSENRLSFCLTVCVLFAVAVFLLAYFGKETAQVLSVMLNKGLDSSGRDSALYPEAWSVFKAHPIFGAGFDYRLGELVHNNYTPYWFHSTALQIVATMGIVGVISFAFFYFWRYRTFLTLAKNPAVLALLAGHALFDAYGMIDTNFFGPSFFLMLLIMTIAVEVNLPANKCRAFGGRDPISDISAAFKFIARKLCPSKFPSAPADPDSSASDIPDSSALDSSDSSTSDLPTPDSADVPSLDALSTQNSSSDAPDSSDPDISDDPPLDSENH